MKILETARLLIVDDQQDPRHDWFARKFPDNPRTHVLKFHDAIDTLTEHTFDVLFLDHDLNDDGSGDIEVGAYRNHEFTGADIASWLTRNLERLPPLVIVHSVNPSGAQSCCKVLEGNCEVMAIPFSSLIVAG